MRICCLLETAIVINHRVLVVIHIVLFKPGQKKAARLGEAGRCILF